METPLDMGALYNKRADVIVAAMTTCTDQIEDYEKRNFGECMSCLGFVAAIIAAISAVLIIEPTKNEQLLSNIFLAIAYILMLFPAAITIFLYNFAMNCRRSAILRGYMQFLEERLNEILRETSMLYHGALFSDEIDLFPVNRYGPMALGAAWVLLFLVCCLLSLVVFSNTESAPYGWVYYIYFGLVGLLLLICVPCCVLYAIALAKNRNAVERTKKTCDKLYSDYSVNSDRLPTLCQLQQIAKKYNEEELMNSRKKTTSKYIFSNL